MRKVLTSVYRLSPSTRDGRIRDWKITDWFAEIPEDKLFEGAILNLHCGYGRFREHMVFKHNNRWAVAEM